jgi:glycosyltransferase involved in cell wall biosynthesis
MRIALLAPGSSIHTARWTNALVDRGHEVHLISWHPPLHQIDPEVRLHHLPFRPPVGYFSNAPVAARLVRQIAPDLLHAHFASGYGTLGRLTRFHPYILSVWGSDVYDFPRKSPLHAGLLRANLAAADRVCSTSHAMAEQTRSVSPDLARISITPFGIDPEAFSPRPERQNPEHVTVGTVKTLKDKYGIDILIRAFAQARSTLTRSEPELAERLRLLIVGGGPKRESLVRLAGELGVDHVTEFTGEVSHAEVPAELARLDLYVAVSRLDSESFGVAVLEASACGLPVLVSDVGGLPEVVLNGITGVVVERENVDETAAAIGSMLRDPAQLRRMGQAGRAHVLRSFQWSDSVTIMESVYDEVLGTDLAGVASSARSRSGAAR